MGAENPHISAIELWGYASGTSHLKDEHFDHLLVCAECQMLVDQIVDALEQLPRTTPNTAA